MLARLPGCATAGSGPWRWCACGPPVSAGPGSGVRSPSRGWPSSSSVCLHWVLCTCLCQCTGGGRGGPQHSLEDPRIIAFGGGGGGIGGLILNKCNPGRELFTFADRIAEPGGLQPGSAHVKRAYTPGVTFRMCVRTSASASHRFNRTVAPTRRSQGKASARRLSHGP
jgi:hypothetical protein